MFAKRTRIIAVMLAVVAFTCIFSACSNNEMSQKLSELDEDALIQRLTDYEITIPANLEFSVIRDIIADLEVDPERPAPVVGWTRYAIFYEVLRNFVKEYNGMSP